MVAVLDPTVAFPELHSLLGTASGSDEDAAGILVIGCFIQVAQANVSRRLSACNTAAPSSLYPLHPFYHLLDSIS